MNITEAEIINGNRFEYNTENPYAYFPQCAPKVEMIREMEGPPAIPIQINYQNLPKPPNLPKKTQFDYLLLILFILLIFLSIIDNDSNGLSYSNYSNYLNNSNNSI